MVTKLGLLFVYDLETATAVRCWVVLTMPVLQVEAAVYSRCSTRCVSVSPLVVLGT